MVRKLAISGCVTVLALVAGCTGSSSTASHASGGGSRGKVSAITAASAASPCPATETKKFSKTAFVTDAGLMAGAFKRWVYQPYQSGAFVKGAPGRAESVAKAAATSGFVLSRLREVKVNAQSEPALCKLTIGAIDKLATTMRAMAATEKKGSVTPSQVTGVVAILTRLQAASAEGGAAWWPQNVSSLPSSN
jgi:hypothetical protein